MNPTPKAPKGAAGRLDQDPESWAAPLFRNEELIQQPADQTQLTRRYTEEAVKFIREHKDAPFFLYLAHTFPHVPLFASNGFSGKSQRGLYGDVVEEIDWSVGQVLETLRQEKLADNTLVFFTSDNGPWLIQGRAGGSAGLLRDGKGSTWEGRHARAGHRLVARKNQGWEGVPCPRGHDGSLHHEPQACGSGNADRPGD